MGPGCSNGESRSPIQADEVVVFFPTIAHRDANSGEWELSVHGWIFEPEKDSTSRNMMIATIGSLLGISSEDAERPIFQRRVRLFLADNEGGKKIPIRLGRSVHVMDASGSNGQFEGKLRLSVDEAGALEAESGWIPYEAVTRALDERSFEGAVRFVDGPGISVVSDIDDTIKISDVTDRSELLANTFLREFRDVPGMASLYREWAADGAVFHYVSSSPWQLYPDLSEFLEAKGFPRGSYHLKSFRLKDTSFFSLFSSPEKSKPETIEPLLEAFPDRRFILVGDSGEKDPEVYGRIARNYPGQVLQILIRDAGPGDRAIDPRYQEAFRDVSPERWQLFTDPGNVRSFALE
jgi:phosphatidate phosphatase APP1